MAKNIDALATKLGAATVGTVPDYSAGAFGMAALANTLRRLLELSVGKRAAGQSDAGCCMILESATASYFQSAAPARNKRPAG